MQDSIAVGFGSVVVQQARSSVRGTWDNRSTSKELPASDARQRGISLQRATQCWAGTYQKTFRASRQGARLCPQSRAPRQGFGIGPANGLQPSDREAPCKSMTLLRSTVLATPGERS